MQADAIPDWAVFLLLFPFIPLAGAIHLVWGMVQTSLIIGAWIRRFILNRRNPEQRLGFFRSVYLGFLILPNIGVIIWEMVNDPAL